MDKIDWLLACTSLAIGICMFLAMNLLINGKNLSNRLLAVFLIAVAIRIGKSLITMMAPQLMELLTAIGVVAMLTIGPSLWLYFQTSYQEIRKKSLKTGDLLHYLPSAILVFLLPVFYREEGLIFVIYLMSVLQLLIYLLKALMIYWNFRVGKSSNPVKNKWGIYFLGGVAIVWLCFVVQLLLETYASYLMATVVAAVVLSVMGLWIMGNGRFNSLNSVSSNSDNLKAVAEKIEELFQETRLYLKGTITINYIADSLELKPYLVSQAINLNFGKSFPELVTDYRIRHAKSLLSDSNHEMNIKEVAYGSGFSTLSAFYSSFRKATRMTPKEYRDRLVN